jgi:hypothetical protein
MNATPLISGWMKVTAALILLAGLLLGGILAAPGIHPVQALNTFPQISAPHSTNSTGVNGTLASFTALIPELFPNYLPFLSK